MESLLDYLNELSAGEFGWSSRYAQRISDRFEGRDGSPLNYAFLAGHYEYLLRAAIAAGKIEAMVAAEQAACGWAFDAGMREAERDRLIEDIELWKSELDDRTESFAYWMKEANTQYRLRMAAAKCSNMECVGEASICEPCSSQERADTAEVAIAAERERCAEEIERRVMQERRDAQESAAAMVEGAVAAERTRCFRWVEWAMGIDDDPFEEALDRIESGAPAPKEG